MSITLLPPPGLLDIPTALVCNKWMMSSAVNDNFFKVFRLFTREKIRVQSIENRSSLNN